MMTLSSKQQRALTTEKHVFVEAAAGSGKTTILVSRYLKILAENPGIELDQILAITFTKEAAREMMERIRSVTKRPMTGARISTIHAFCTSVLRQFPIEAGLDPGFEVLESAKANEMSRKAIIHTLWKLEEAQDSTLLTLAVIQSMARIKERLITAFQKQTCEPELTPIFEKCEQYYGRLKHALGTADFNDLILKTRAVLTSHAHVRKYYQTKLTHIMVDEFQDTDPHQWAIIQLLLPDGLDSQKPNLFIVGDIKQSIYSFRGADHTVFQEALNQFKIKDTEIIDANDNYRCSPQVADFVNLVCEPLFEPSISYSPLICHRPEAKGSVTKIIFDEKTPVQVQVGHIVDWICGLNPAVPYGKIAILFRKKYLLSAFQKQLLALGIPAQVHGGLGFFQKQEIIDMVNLMRVLNNPDDRQSYIGLLKSPFFDYSDLQTHSMKKNDLVTSWQAQRDTQNPRQLIEKALIESNAWSRYSGWENGTQAVANIQKFLRMVQDQIELQHLWGDIERHFTQCIESDFTQAEAEILDVFGNAVHLMTVHAAKGLEFEAVVLPELDTRFNLSDGDPVATIDEEKRIFYVAATRARDHLLMMGRAQDKSILGLILPFTPPSLPLERGGRKVEFIKALPLTKGELAGVLAIDPTQTPQKITYSVLSASEVLAYQRCPKQYQYRQLISVINRVEAYKNPFNRDTAEFGTLAHDVFAKLIDQQPLPVLPLIHKQKLLHLADQFQSSDLFTEIQNSDAHFTERNFSFSVGQLTITGRFDLIYSLNNQWVLVDYKTDINPDPTQARHDDQMKLYMLALKQMFELEQDSYEAKIYYTGLGSIQKLSWSATDLNNYANELVTLKQKPWVSPPLSVCKACSYYQLDSSCPTKEMYVY